MTLDQLDDYRVTVPPRARPGWSGLRWVPSPAALVDLVRREPGPVGARLAVYRVTLVPVRIAGTAVERRIAG